MCRRSGQASGRVPLHATSVGGMQIPDHLRYSDDHEWVAATGSRARIGITDYAQDALGDVVYVQLPQVGAVVVAGQSFGEVESTKSVSDVYSPVSGTVVAVNEALASTPELLNTDPYGDGWVCELELSAPTEIDTLLTATAYAQLIAG